MNKKSSPLQNERYNTDYGILDLAGIQNTVVRLAVGRIFLIGLLYSFLSNIFEPNIMLVIDD